MKKFIKKASVFFGLDEWEVPVVNTGKAALLPPFRHLFWELFGLRRQNIEIVYGTPDRFTTSRYLNLHNKEQIWGIRIFGMLCLSKTDDVCHFAQALGKCRNGERLPNISEFQNTIRPFIKEINGVLKLMQQKGIDAEEITEASYWTSEIKDQYEIFSIHLGNGQIRGYQRHFNLYTRTKMC